MKGMKLEIGVYTPKKSLNPGKINPGKSPGAKYTKYAFKVTYFLRTPPANESAPIEREIQILTYIFRIFYAFY